MTFNLARLRAIARGETIPQRGVSRVTALQAGSAASIVTPQIIDVTPVTYVTPPQYEVRKEYSLRVDGGVAGGVTCGAPSIADAGPAAIVTYAPVELQRDADRRNAAAREAKITDRWCACGTMATLAVGAFHSNKSDAGARWLCVDCFSRADLRATPF